MTNGLNGGCTNHPGPAPETTGLLASVGIVHGKPFKPDDRMHLGSQSGTVETNPDRSTDIYFGPTAPDGRETNWLQTIPGKGWFTVLRFYNPLPSFFDKTWRPSEIEPT